MFLRRGLVHPHAKAGLNGGHGLFQGAYPFVMFVQTTGNTLGLLIDALADVPAMLIDTSGQAQLNRHNSGQDGHADNDDRLHFRSHGRNIASFSRVSHNNRPPQISITGFGYF